MSEWSARVEEFRAVVGEVVAMVGEAAADPDLTFERAAALSRSTEDIAAALHGLIAHLRSPGVDADFIEALERMLGTLRTADMQAGQLVIRTSGVLRVA